METLRWGARLLEGFSSTKLNIRTIFRSLATLSVTPKSVLETNSTLLPYAYDPLPLGSVTASGWLQVELEASANGLGGHLHDFWPFVSRSTWTGGDTEYSVLNEALPYWLNAMVPLAYTIDDARLKSDVHNVVSAILERVQPDGWIGPEPVEAGKRMIWARALLFFGLTNLADANETWTEPIVTAMHNFNGIMNEMLRNNGTGLIYHEGDVLSAADYSWGQARTEEHMVSIQWLLDKYPRGNEAVLKENIDLLHHFGTKWENWYVEGVYIKDDFYNYPDSVTDTLWEYLHGVTIAEGLKAAASLRRSTFNESLVETSKNGVNWTFTYHGSASGTILADERIDGLAPYYGSELCTHVETIFSLAYIYQAIGDPYYADRAELAAFNALPAALSADWWSHQYLTQPNQPFSKNLSGNPFYDVNTQAQTFGLEPNYPCCTVNHPQGLPKYVMYSYSRVGENGLLHSLLGPTSVNFSLPSGKVSVVCTTTYPFGNVLEYEIESEGDFDFYVRVPAWAEQTELEAASGKASISGVDPESLLRKVGVGSGHTKLTYTVDDSSIRVSERANQTVSVYRGQLLYAIHIPSIVTEGPPKHYRNQSVWAEGTAPPQAHDYTLLNATEWNIAIDPSTLQYHSGASNGSQVDLPQPTWGDGGLPMSITAKACLISWDMFEAVPGWPAPPGSRKCLGETFETKLVPYGSAKLHMADIPVIDLSVH